MAVPTKEQDVSNIDEAWSDAARAAALAARRRLAHLQGNRADGIGREGLPERRGRERTKDDPGAGPKYRQSTTRSKEAAAASGSNRDDRPFLDAETEARFREWAALPDPLGSSANRTREKFTAHVAAKRRLREEAIEEAARRGSDRKLPIRRLPNGQFAPKGMGRVLAPGDTLHVGRGGKVMFPASSPVSIKTGQTVEVVGGTAADPERLRVRLPNGRVTDLTDEEIGQFDLKQRVATPPQSPGTGAEPVTAWKGREIGQSARFGGGSATVAEVHGDGDNAKFTLRLADGSMTGKIGFSRLADVLAGRKPLPKPQARRSASAPRPVRLSVSELNALVGSAATDNPYLQDMADDLGRAKSAPIQMPMASLVDSRDALRDRLDHDPDSLAGWGELAVFRSALGKLDREIERREAREGQAAAGRTPPASPGVPSATFDPRQHPRDRNREFQRALGRIRTGESVSLPDGTVVTRGQRYHNLAVRGATGSGSGTAYVVRGNDGSVTRVYSSEEAVNVALAKSAASSHPDSLGGTTAHPSIRAFEASPGEVARRARDQEAADRAQFDRDRAEGDARIARLDAARRPDGTIRFRNGEGRTGTMYPGPSLDPYRGGGTPVVVTWDDLPNVGGRGVMPLTTDIEPLDRPAPASPGVPADRPPRRMPPNPYTRAENRGKYMAFEYGAADGVEGRPRKTVSGANYQAIYDEAYDAAAIPQGRGANVAAIRRLRTEGDRLDAGDGIKVTRGKYGAWTVTAGGEEIGQSNLAERVLEMVDSARPQRTPPASPGVSLQGGQRGDSYVFHSNRDAGSPRAVRVPTDGRMTLAYEDQVRLEKGTTEYVFDRGRDGTWRLSGENTYGNRSGIGGGPGQASGIRVEDPALVARLNRTRDSNLDAMADFNARRGRGPGPITPARLREPRGPVPVPDMPTAIATMARRPPQSPGTYPEGVNTDAARRAWDSGTHVFHPDSPMMRRVRAMSDAELANPNWMQPLNNAVSIERARRSGDPSRLNGESLRPYLAAQRRDPPASPGVEADEQGAWRSNAASVLFNIGEDDLGHRLSAGPVDATTARTALAAIRDAQADGWRPGEDERVGIDNLRSYADSLGNPPPASPGTGVTSTRRGTETSFKDDSGKTLALAYLGDDGRNWYAADSEGEDLDGGWRLPSREVAERVAQAHAERVWLDREVARRQPPASPGTGTPGTPGVKPYPGSGKFVVVQQHGDGSASVVDGANTEGAARAKARRYPGTTSVIPNEPGSPPAPGTMYRYGKRATASRVAPPASPGVPSQTYRVQHDLAGRAPDMNAITNRLHDLEVGERLALEGSGVAILRRSRTGMDAFELFNGEGRSLGTFPAGMPVPAAAAAVAVHHRGDVDVNAVKGMALGVAARTPGMDRAIRREMRSPGVPAEDEPYMNSPGDLAAKAEADEFDAQIDREVALRGRLAAILASKDPTLGLTVPQAEALRDAIIDADWSDDEALRAHDLLHTRAWYGRAF